MPKRDSAGGSAEASATLFSVLKTRDALSHAAKLRFSAQRIRAIAGSEALRLLLTPRRENAFYAARGDARKRPSLPGVG